jgi:hypothetical protein
MGGNYLTKTVTSRRDSGHFNLNIILQDVTLKLCSVSQIVSDEAQPQSHLEGVDSIPQLTLPL